jgi:hypothetical protein
MRIPNNIRLADEEFNVSKPIDLLIGAEICILENIMCRPDQSAKYRSDLSENGIRVDY